MNVSMRDINRAMLASRTYGCQPWARRLHRKLAAKHDLNHFTGCAWRVVSSGQGQFFFSRIATNGDRLEFHPIDANTGNPFVNYFKKGPANAVEAPSES
jgi:hypothetical protein